MYEIKIKTGFAAAHSLREYDGECEDLHGHNFSVEVCVKAKELDNTGLAIDFRVLKEKTHVIMDQLDHKYLNDLPYFALKNPSSENIAAYIFENLRDSLRGEHVSLDRITVWESANSCASYYED